VKTGCSYLKSRSS